MANNEQAIIHTFTDGMSMDSGTMYKDNKSVVDALNFTILPNEENTGFQASNKRGNRFSFTFPGCNLNNQIDISFNPLDSDCNEVEKWTYYFNINIGSIVIPIKIEYRKGLNYSNYRKEIESQIKDFFDLPGNANDELELDIKIFSRNSSLSIMYYGCDQGFNLSNSLLGQSIQGANYKSVFEFIKRNENVSNFFHILGWGSYEGNLYIITNNEASKYFQIWKVDYDLYNNSTVVKSSNDCGFLNPETPEGRQLTYRDHLIYNGSLTSIGINSKDNLFTKEFPIYNEIEFTREDDCFLRMTFTDNNNSIIHLNIEDPNIMAYDANSFRMNPRIEPSVPYLHQVNNYGGNLKVGSYQAFVTYRDRLGNDIVVQTLSALTPVYSYDGIDNFCKISGSEINTDSTMSLTYKIAGLDPRYDKIGFGIIKYELENVPIAHLITEIDINGQYSVEYTYTGFEEIEVYPLERLRYGSNPIDIAKTIETSKGAMLYGNVKSGSVYEIDWSEFDVRAYRWRNKNGVIDSYPIQYNGAITISTLNWNTIGVKEDVVNPYNDHSGRNFDSNAIINQTTINKYYDDYQYKYKSDGITIGGEGPWIEYDFVFDETEEDILSPANNQNLLIADLGNIFDTEDGLDETDIQFNSVGALNATDSELDYPSGTSVNQPFIAVPKGKTADFVTPPLNTTLIDYHGINCCGNKKVKPIYKNQKDSLYVTHRRGFQNGEVYRFGIVAHSGSRNSPTQWIADIKIPDIGDFQNINSLSDVHEYNNSLSLASNIDQRLLKHKIIGIKFNIKNFALLNDFLNKNEIDYFSIVYVERKDSDYTNLGNGFANPLENAYDADLDIQVAINRSLFTGATTPKSTTDGTNLTDYFRDWFTIDIPYLHFSSDSKSTGSDYISIDGEYRHAFYSQIHRAIASYADNDKFSSNDKRDSKISYLNSAAARVYYWEQQHQFPYSYASIHNPILRRYCRYKVNKNVKVPYGDNGTNIYRGGDFSGYAFFNTAIVSKRTNESGTGSRHWFASICNQTNIVNGNSSGVFNYNGTNWRVYLYGVYGAWATKDGDCLGEIEQFAALNRYMVSYRRYLSSQYNGPFYKNRAGQCYQSANCIIKVCRNPISATLPDYSKSSSISFSGDTYVGLYTYTKFEPNIGPDITYYSKNKDKNSFTANASYAATAPFNFHLRHGKYFINEDLSKPTTWETPEEFKYNTAYSQKNNFIAYCTSLEDFENCQEHSPFRIYYSDTKLSGESIDSYKTVRPLNYVDLNPSYGEIMDIISFNDKIYCFQRSAVSMVELRPVSALQDTNNRTINIGTGEGIITQYITTESGTNHKWSVIKSGVALYYFDVNNRKIMRITGNGIEPLSDVLGWSSFMKHNIQGLLRADNLLFGPTVHFFADKVRDTVYFTFINKKEGDEYNCIYEKEGDETTPVDYPNVYNYTLSYLEKYQKGECFNSFTPYMYTGVSGLMLSIEPETQQLENSSDSVFIHNIGRYGQFYEFSFNPAEWLTRKIFPWYIRLISNTSIMTTKIFDNLSFDMEVQEVVSHNRYINYGNTGTVQDVHNMDSSDTSEVFPVDYHQLPQEYDEPFDTSLNPNDEHGRVIQCHLRFFNSFQATTLQPLVYNHSENPRADLNETRMLYDRRERTWRVRIPRDIHNTSNLQNPNPIPIRYKPRMSDKWLGIELMFDNNKYLYKQIKDFKHLDQKIVLYYIKVDFRVSHF